MIQKTEMTVCICENCGNVWTPKQKEILPKVCPNTTCHSTHWNDKGNIDANINIDIGIESENSLPEHIKKLIKYYIGNIIFHPDTAKEFHENLYDLGNEYKFKIKEKICL